MCVCSKCKVCVSVSGVVFIQHGVNRPWHRTLSLPSSAETSASHSRRPVEITPQQEVPANLEQSRGDRDWPQVLF